MNSRLCLFVRRSRHDVIELNTLYLHSKEVILSTPHEPFVTATGMVVDPQRFDSTDMHLFIPLMVRRTESLRRALALNGIDAEREVLVAKVTNGVLVFDKAQLSYYHTAQGEYRGQPWLVCF
jgi:hypothetical protein